MPDTSNAHRAQWKFNALYADTEVRRVSDDKLLAVVHAGSEQARIVGALKAADKPGTALLRGEGEQFTRFCPGCGSVGEVEAKFRDCCPDGAGARLIPTSLAQKCHELFRLALVGASQPELSDSQPNAALADGWISVDERSPKLYERVMVITTDCYDEPYATPAHYNGPGKFLGVGGVQLEPVTHWQEIDAPPVGWKLPPAKPRASHRRRPAPPTLNASKEAGNG